jgi:hypothetical protein
MWAETRAHVVIVFLMVVVLDRLHALSSSAMAQYVPVPRGYVYDKYYICMTNPTPRVS